MTLSTKVAFRVGQRVGPWLSLGRRPYTCAQVKFISASADAVMTNTMVPDDECGKSKIMVRDLLNMKAESHSQVVNKPHWIRDDAVAIQAAQQMTSSNVGALLVYKFEVLDKNQDGIIQDEELRNSVKAIAGIVTERDCLRTIAAHPKHQYMSDNKLLVKHIMTTTADGMATVSPRHTILEAMEIMISKHVRHIPVVEGDNMEGMISIRDVVEMVLREQRDHMSLLNNYIFSGGSADYHS